MIPCILRQGGYRQLSEPFARCYGMFTDGVGIRWPLFPTVKTTSLMHCPCRGVSWIIPRNTSRQALYYLFVPFTGVCLGTWQIFRWRSKLKIIEGLNQIATRQAVPIPQDLTELKDMQWHKVKFSGFFDHSREMHVGPRIFTVDTSAPKERTKRLKKYHSQYGFHVITPFLCVDNGQRFLVNRGWVPTDKKDAHERLAGQIEGEVEIVAIVREGDKKPPFAKPNTSRHWDWRDLDGMSELGKCKPYIVDVCSSSEIPGGPIGGQTIQQISNRHVEYIITWYGLAVASAIVIHAMWKKRLNHEVLRSKGRKLSIPTESTVDQQPPSRVKKSDMPQETRV